MKRMIEFLKKNRLYRYLLITLVLSASAAVVYAASVPNIFTAGTIISSNEVNENFSYLADRSWELSGSDLYYDNGNVGIGTTGPSRKLHIYDDFDGAVNPQLRLQLDNSYVEFWGGENLHIITNNGQNHSVVILENGNVSIGTKDPIRADRKLHIYDDGIPQFRLEQSNGYIDLWGGENFHIITGSTHRFFVSGVNGNVGIGTNSPQQKLDVEGFVEAFGYITGDIIFQKDGERLWRMFEEKDGLYLENLETGKTSKVFLEEDIASLKEEIVKELRKEIAELRALLHERQ